MKKIDLGQSISVLANIGVIAGIVFLAVELRQNNQLMEAEARLAAHQGGQEFAMTLTQNPDLARILARVSQAEPLSEAEEIQVLRSRVVCSTIFPVRVSGGGQRRAIRRGLQRRAVACPFS